MGRPREFDREEALQTAMRVFWAHGYEATSMTDLRKAIGIGRQSLYDTFGDKQALFAEALEHYVGMGEQGMKQVLAGKDGLTAVRAFVLLTTERLASGGPVPGCMIVKTCVELAPHDPAVAARLRTGLSQAREQLEAALQRAQNAGDLRDGLEPADAASFLATVVHGLAVSASAGVSPDELRSVAAVALYSLT